MSKKRSIPNTLKPEHNVQIPVEVLCHKDMTGNTLMVYGYMKLRYQFFNSIGKEYRESHRTMADALGISIRTTLSSISSLQVMGFVVMLVHSGGQGYTNTYKIVDCLVNKKIKQGNMVSIDDESDPF